VPERTRPWSFGSKLNWCWRFWGNRAVRHRRSEDVETKELHRGRLIDHVHLVVADIVASRRFYEAILAVLDIPLGGFAEDYFWADELFVSTADSKAALGRLTGRHHLAFQARDRETVERFHASGLAHGGRDNGGPGLRGYHPGYYAAFLLDPDGNNIEAVFHGEAIRSSDSVKITF
jgi:catechol 2,3-dioxygenase-like lactoylglutathione lyase family enzyme